MRLPDAAFRIGMRWLALSLLTLSLAGCSRQHPEGYYWLGTRGDQRLWIVPTLHLSPVPLALPADIQALQRERPTLALELDPGDRESVSAFLTCKRAAIAWVDPPDEASVERLRTRARAAWAGRGNAPDPSLEKGPLPEAILGLAAQPPGPTSVGNGLDIALRSAAGQYSAPVVSLEDPCPADAPAVTVTTALLSEWLAAAEDRRVDALMKAAVDAWQRRDPDALARALADSAARLPLDAAWSQPILARRNRLMARRIAMLLSTRESLLVGVGALHTIGPDSLLDLLHQDGWRFERRDGTHAGGAHAG